MLPAIQIALFGIQLCVAFLDFFPPFRQHEKGYLFPRPVPTLSKDGKIVFTPPIIASKSAWLLCIPAHYLGEKATLTSITSWPCN